MAKQKIEHNSECNSDSHKEHLCYIISQGFHLSEPELLKGIVEDPRFKCQHCGRTADSEKNLCEPMPL